METLFTIPIPTLTYSLSGVFFLAMLATGALALRRPVVFKMAIRNIPRRKAQTSLIVLGLMLATLLFSASFATGDTLAHSIRVLTLEYIGPVDEIITSTNREESGEASYIDDSIFQKIQDASADAKIDGLTPLIYLGGVFYSIHLLPEFWKNISLVNPLMYMINAFRHGMLGTSDLETLGFSVNFAIFMMIVFITIIYSVALWLLNSGRGIRS